MCERQKFVYFMRLHSISDYVLVCLRLCVCKRENVCVSVCVCVCGTERVCVCDRERESVCV